MSISFVSGNIGRLIFVITLYACQYVDCGRKVIMNYE